MKKTTSDKTLPYRPNVCAVITDTEQEKVLLFRRLGKHPQAWQFPQGGIDANESPQDALYRELLEEIGTNDIELLAESEDWIYYDFPDWVLEEHQQHYPKRKLHCGQKQRWYLARLNQGIDAIHFSHEPAEFDAFEWATPEDALERTVSFKKNAYYTGLSMLGMLS